MIVLPLQLLQLTQDSEGTDILLSDFDVAIPMEKKTPVLRKLLQHLLRLYSETIGSEHMKK